VLVELGVVEQRHKAELPAVYGVAGWWPTAPNQRARIRMSLPQYAGGRS
jgi:hypothetical protein